MYLSWRIIVNEGKGSSPQTIDEVVAFKPGVDFDHILASAHLASFAYTSQVVIEATIFGGSYIVVVYGRNRRRVVFMDERILKSSL